jgi:hypothetical protein
MRDAMRFGKLTASQFIDIAACHGVITPTQYAVWRLSFVLGIEPKQIDKMAHIPLAKDVRRAAFFSVLRNPFLSDLLQHVVGMRTHAKGPYYGPWQRTNAAYSPPVEQIPEDYVFVDDVPALTSHLASLRISNAGVEYYRGITDDKTENHRKIAIRRQV